MLGTSMGAARVAGLLRHTVPHPPRGEGHQARGQPEEDSALNALESPEAVGGLVHGVADDPLPLDTSEVEALAMHRRAQAPDGGIVDHAAQMIFPSRVDHPVERGEMGLYGPGRESR